MIFPVTTNNVSGYWDFLQVFVRNFVFLGTTSIQFRSYLGWVAENVHDFLE